MELNSYIQQRAFAKSTVEELEKCFREINNVISSKSIIEISFLYNSNLLMPTQMGDGNTIADWLYGLPMPDRQLQTRVIPKLLSMLPDTSDDFADIEQLKSAYPNDLNSFWGIHFAIHKEYHLHSTEECSNFINVSMWRLMDASTFSWLYPILLPNIIVADSALSQIEGLGVSNNFSIVIEDLKKLNCFCESWSSGTFSITTLKQSFAIDTTDESNSTKSNEKLKSYRRFQLKGLGSQYCFLHIKHGDYRLHYFPDNCNRQIHIGYVGKHLPI